MKLSDFIFKFLNEEYNIKDVFMVSGGGAMHLNDSVGNNKNINVICCHHEQACAIAADGYSRINGNLSVVNVTTGPGGTNTLTGVIGEYLDSVPVLYISGQVKFETTIESCRELNLRQLGDQEINIIDIVKPVTKYAAMIKDPSKIKYEIQKAIHIAKSGRKGPVWLDIPLDVQASEIDENNLEEYKSETINKPIIKEQIDEVINILQNAKSPVIIAGHGIRLSNSIKEFYRLIDKLDIPVLSTFNGFDIIPTDNKNYVGRIGTIGNRYGNIILQNADVVLSLASRNNIRQISYNYENFAKNARHIIGVDIDNAELNKPTINYTLKINNDVNLFINTLNDSLENIEVNKHTKWREWTLNIKNKYSKLLNEYTTSNDVNPYYFTYELTNKLSNDAIVTCTNATPSLALFQVGSVKTNNRMFCNSGCAAMGFGLPASIGAAVASKDKEVICLEGDGSLMMNIQELQTIAHYNLNIKLFLFNNNEYASIRQTQDNFFKRRTGCDFNSGVSFPNWEFIARAFNLKYYCIDKKENINNVLDEILNINGPVFCNVILEKDYLFLPKISSEKLPNGKMVSRSLEDMTPLLSKEELEENIYKG